MGACPIDDAEYLPSTELQFGPLVVFLSGSNVPGTERILAQTLPEQSELCRWRGGAGQGVAMNVAGM
jgi:hypothetical protein